MKRKITDIAEIRTGYQFRKRIEPVDDGTHRVVQIKDIKGLTVQPDELIQVSLDMFDERHLLQKGDVIFLARGRHNWASAITLDLKNTVASSYFFVLRLKSPDVLPEYLAWYINQPPAQKYLYSLAKRGSHIPLVPLSSFISLTIRIPSLDKQKSIVELNKLLNKERQLHEKIGSKRNLLINSVCLKMTKTEQGE